jgi:hypothetical protein
MKVLFVTGDDYAATDFENRYKGESAKVVIDQEDSEETFEGDDGKVTLEYEVLEVEGNEEQLMKLVAKFKQFNSDRKHKQVYAENEIIQ